MDTDAGFGDLNPVHRARPSLLKVATGFELTKRFANKKLQKTIVQGARFGDRFEPKIQAEKQHKLMLFKEKQLAANQCGELLDFKSG